MNIQGLNCYIRNMESKQLFAVPFNDFLLNSRTCNALNERMQTYPISYHFQLQKYEKHAKTLAKYFILKIVNHGFNDWTKNMRKLAEYPKILSFCWDLYFL